MRKLYGSLLLLAAGMLTLSSCSSSDDIDGNGGSKEGSYIAVNIMNTQAAPGGAKAMTRAEGDYADGTENEGYIKKIRFYFFDNNGNPFQLENSLPAGVNWLEVTNPDDFTMGNGDASQTVERSTSAVMLINGVNGNAPAAIVAVANPDSLKDASTNNDNILGLGSLTLRQLEASTLLTTSYGSSRNFVMTNSVYDHDGSMTCATPTENVFTTRQQALANPTDIYVERLAAKVSVNHGSDPKWEEKNVNGTIKLTYDLGAFQGISNSNDTTISHVYAVVDGWGLSDEQRFGKVEKDLYGYTSNTSRADATSAQITANVNNLGFSPWNTADYHRSFWEVSPSFNATGNDNPVDYSWSTYNRPFTGANHTGDEVAYTMPNTPERTTTDSLANRNGNRTYRTKVLLAVNLMYQTTDGPWKPAEISRYRGVEFLTENSLKDAILNDMKDRLVKVTTTDGVRTASNLTRNDIDFYVPSSTQTDIKSYQLSLQLNWDSDADGYAFMNLQNAQDSLADGHLTLHGTAEAGEVLRTFAKTVEVRKDGQAYYYTTIRHLSDDQSKLGYFGVVRNHWYQVNIESLKGWGTPVYDPNQIIVPVTPNDSQTYLAARINVLQWRVVGKNYNIDGSTITNPTESSAR